MLKSSTFYNQRIRSKADRGYVLFGSCLFTFHIMSIYHLGSKQCLQYAYNPTSQHTGRQALLMTFDGLFVTRKILLNQLVAALTETPIL